MKKTNEIDTMYDIKTRAYLCLEPYRTVTELLHNFLNKNPIFTNR